MTLRNFGSKTVSLKGYVLRDAADHAIKFKKTTIKSKRSVVVVTGCRKGSKKAVRKGTRYYACRTKEFWDDAGDVVELVNAKGGLLSHEDVRDPAGRLTAVSTRRRPHRAGTPIRTAARAFATGTARAGPTRCRRRSRRRRRPRATRRRGRWPRT